MASYTGKSSVSPMRASIALFTSDALNFAPVSLYSQTGALVLQSQPSRIQLARMDCPVPPLEPSMSRISNPPGPTLLRVSVVATPRQGQPGPASSGCVLMTANGAEPQAAARFSARATDVVFTVVELMPITCRKVAGTVCCACTVTVSFG